MTQNKAVYVDADVLRKNNIIASKIETIVAGWTVYVVKGIPRPEDGINLVKMNQSYWNV